MHKLRRLLEWILLAHLLFSKTSERDLHSFRLTMKDCPKCELKGRQCNDCTLVESVENLKKEIWKDIEPIIRKILDAIEWVFKKLRILP